MVAAVVGMHYSKRPAGAAISPISSIRPARGSYGAAAGAMALTQVCSTRATTMASATISTVSVLPCH